jgi:hypothetical protein
LTPSPPTTFRTPGFPGVLSFTREGCLWASE